MHKKHHLLWLALIPILAVAGYAVMHGLIYALPVSENNTTVNILFTCFIIAMGLAIPYFMLKIGMHEAHLQNPDEKELRLRDIPKDKQQISREQ